jgi:integrase
VRVTVPKDLRDVYGREEIWRSLGTASPSEAKALAPTVLQELHDDFQARRHGRDLIESDIAALAWQHYAKLIESDERFRETAPTEDDLDNYWRLMVADNGGDQYDYETWRLYEFTRDMVRRNQLARRAKLALLKSSDPDKQLKAVARPLANLLEERRIMLDRRSATFRKLALGIQRAELEALKRADERDAGDWGGTPSDPMIKRAEQPKNAAPGERIADLYERFIKQRGAKLKPDTISENRKIIQLFAEHVGENVPVSALKRKHVAEWRDKLHLFPSRARQIREFEGLKFAQIIERNRSLGKPVLDPKTINRYLSGFSPFASWLVSSDLVPAPIMLDEMFLKLDRSVPKRFPWTDDQLRAIFSSPLFTGCRADNREYEPGNLQIRDWRYWIPLIALFSGMRLGEIAQLLVDDVREEHGVWIMHVTTDGDDAKTLKTTGSERIVPLHPTLIALGLLEHHARQKQAGHARLFAEIKPDKRGFLSGPPSKFFSTYLKRIGVKTKQTTTHSFRHNFADRLRAAGHLDHDFGFILGHGDRLIRTTGRYGSLPQGTLQMRKALVESVDYSDLKIGGA